MTLKYLLGPLLGAALLFTGWAIQPDSAEAHGGYYRRGCGYHGGGGGYYRRPRYNQARFHRRKARYYNRRARYHRNRHRDIVYGHDFHRNRGRYW